MISLTLASILCLPLAATPSETYGEAHKANRQTGFPMVVLVGAEWCPACQHMKTQIVPQMRQRGLLKRIAFALVDLDQETELGHDLTAGGPIPQLILFRRTHKGWTQRKLIGGQSLQTVEELITEEVAANETEIKLLAASAVPKTLSKATVKSTSLTKDAAEAKAASKPPACTTARLGSLSEPGAAMGAKR